MFGSYPPSASAGLFVRDCVMDIGDSRAKNILTGAPAPPRVPDYSEACDCAPTQTGRCGESERGKAKHHFNLIQLYRTKTAPSAGHIP